MLQADLYYVQCETERTPSWLCLKAAQDGWNNYEKGGFNIGCASEYWVNDASNVGDRKGVASRQSLIGAGANDPLLFLPPHHGNTR